MKHDIEEIVKEFEKKAKKLFTHGGLCDVLDYPPHEQVLDEKEVAEFIRSQFPKYATQQIEAFREAILKKLQNTRYEATIGTNVSPNFKDGLIMAEAIVQSLPTDKK